MEQPEEDYCCRSVSNRMTIELSAGRCWTAMGGNVKTAVRELTCMYITSAFVPKAEQMLQII